MERPPHLYEPAAVTAEALGPFWYLDQARTCFIGPLIYNAAHQHGAPVFLAGLYGSFGLRIRGGDWHSCRTAVIPAGVSHELDVGGQPIGVFYIEPNLDGAGALAPLVREGEALDGALIGRTGEFGLMRELWEDSASLNWASAALDDLIGFAQPRARREFDRRIARAVAAMDGPVAVETAALAADLSPSRFQHLFTEEVGVPFRRYRAWMRMRAAIAEIAAGSSFTQAAHAAGFFDQAHFNRDFRRTFGAVPSISLYRVRM
ncbi:helix-turn-helix transcriptional regulator [Starkeya sp. ORNL1]|uniref:helix-turn-helix transcriptional regulator n=1 Tax=Starkeya sp. ORNL1 TaxID=2709380 RepID=UPI0014643E0D|nr:helix-turn-helix transcriptional regulator [Starkeya sp. ORNL1]QJP14120.1 helix-turn-helix transcriptional regulator [Starkeya sp. ORNL1]